MCSREAQRAGPREAVQLCKCTVCILKGEERRCWSKGWKGLGMEGEIKTKINTTGTKVIYTFYVRIYKFPLNQHSSKREGPLGTMEVREEVGSRAVHRGPWPSAVLAIQPAQVHGSGFTVVLWCAGLYTRKCEETKVSLSRLMHCRGDSNGALQRRKMILQARGEWAKQRQTFLRIQPQSSFRHPGTILSVTSREKGDSSGIPWKWPGWWLHSLPLNWKGAGVSCWSGRGLGKALGKEGDSRYFQKMQSVSLLII